MTDISRKFLVVLERPVSGFDPEDAPGAALARVAEVHPALSTLLDYDSPDPIPMAVAVGVTYPLDADEMEELQEIDFGPAEWFEPSAGLAAVRKALRVVRDDPGSVAAALYDPGLRAEAVVRDLEAVEQTLLLAQQHETRFHFALRA